MVCHDRTRGAEIKPVNLPSQVREQVGNGHCVGKNERECGNSVEVCTAGKGLEAFQEKEAAGVRLTCT